jgi:AbrB family looped-hinge helix DNA binding protein
VARATDSGIPTNIAIDQTICQTGLMTAAPTPIRLGPQGRLVVPVELRRELGLEEGTELSIRSDGRRLILEPRPEVLRRLRRRFARLPDDVSLADELIAERRDEARRESGE